MIFTPWERGLEPRSKKHKVAYGEALSEAPAFVAWMALLFCMPLVLCSISDIEHPFMNAKRSLRFSQSAFFTSALALRVLLVMWV